MPQDSTNARPLHLEEGARLQQLINRTRFVLAEQLLRNTGLSVAEIAMTLHYEDPNGSSRAIRNWAQASPMQWRAGAG